MRIIWPLRHKRPADPAVPAVAWVLEDDPLMPWEIADLTLADRGPYQAAVFSAQLHEQAEATADEVSRRRLFALAYAVHARCLEHGWRYRWETPDQFRDRMSRLGRPGPLPGRGCGLADKEEPW